MSYLVLDASPFVLAGQRGHSLKEQLSMLGRNEKDSAIYKHLG